MVSPFTKIGQFIAQIVFCMMCFSTVVNASSLDVDCAGPYGIYEFEIEETSNFSTIDLPIEIELVHENDGVVERVAFQIEEITELAEHEGYCVNGDRVSSYRDFVLIGTLKFDTSKSYNPATAPYTALCRFELWEFAPDNCGGISHKRVYGK